MPEASIQTLAEAFVREVGEVLKREGALRTLPGMPNQYHLTRDWHMGDLESAKSYDTLKTALEQLGSTRCRTPNEAIRGLIDLWLFDSGQFRSLRGVVAGWLRAVTASEWLEYYAFGFDQIKVQNRIRLGPSIEILPHWKAKVPTRNRIYSPFEPLFSPVQTWFIHTQRVSTPYPDAGIRSYPYSTALFDALCLLWTPLLRECVHSTWDGPITLKSPIHVKADEIGYGEIVITRRDAKRIGEVYEQARVIRGTDFWRGVNAFSKDKDRIELALNYLKSCGTDRNIFQGTVRISTCLEALLGEKDSEISHRISERTAVLVGLTDEDRWDVYQHVRGLYDLRSILLHEGTVTAADARNIRRKMLPNAKKIAGWPLAGDDFMAPFHVSLEIARRAVLAAWRNRHESGTFDRQRLDRAIFMADERPKNSVSIISHHRTPIREWSNHIIQADFPRMWMKPHDEIL